MEKTNMGHISTAARTKIGTLVGMATAVAAITAIGWGTGMSFATVGSGVYQNVGSDVYNTVGSDVYNTVGNDVYNTVGDDVYGSISDMLDIDEGTPHYADVKWVVESGISTGFSDRTFRPYSETKRCDMAAFLFRLATRWGLVDKSWQPSTAQTQAFADVTDTTPHAREIWWLASSGISSGWDVIGGKKEFRPYENVKRQDMAAFLFRLAKLAGKGGASDSWTAPMSTIATFVDVNPNQDDNHHQEIWWLSNSKVSEGWKVGDTYEFRGTIDIARCDMAAFMARMNRL